MLIPLFLPILPLGAQITVENETMKLVLSEKGYAEALVCKATGENMLADGEEARVPLCTITQNRPYDNENFLMFPAKPMVFPSNSISRSGDTLYVEFKDTYDIAVISMDICPDYIAFTLVRRDYRIEDMGVKRKTELDEFALLQLPVLNRGHFGEWLNVSWNESAGVCLLGTSPQSRIDSHVGERYSVMTAGMDNRVSMTGTGAALIVAPYDRLLPCIDSVEKDFDLPRGVQSRLREDYNRSYYELRDVTPSNIDRNIALAKQAGLECMVIYYPDFAVTCGHYLWNKDRYPRGMEDLKEVVGKIKAAGLKPGFHIHYSKVSHDDPYIRSAHPDRRLASVVDFILTEDIAPDAVEISFTGNPAPLRTEDGRRLLQIDDEFVFFESVSEGRFVGCRRGAYGSTASAHSAGTRFTHPDVDDWPRFIRVDQDTDIQKEIAASLADIYDSCGFEFLYFDGAEDVHDPYWYNVSRAQKEVYDALCTKPAYSEGALKSHFGWHILTRGNAFDLFRPEKIRPAMKKYTLRCAARNADDFTAVNFGWVDTTAPDSTTIGMQPDMYEYICSKALAWDSPISYIAYLDKMDANPRTEDNLTVIRRWENAKRMKLFSKEEKEMLKDPEREFTLLEDKKGNLSLQEWHQLTPDSCRPVRAFSYSKDGRSYIVCWAIEGSPVFTLDTGAGKKKIRAGKRVTVESSLPLKEFEKRFIEAIEKL